MPLFEILASFLVVITLATTAAFYSYGRFARRAKGEPSSALPVRDDATPLDRELAPLLRNYDGATGLVLLSDNLILSEIRPEKPSHCHLKTWISAGVMMTTNSTGRKNRIIGTVSMGGSEAAFFSAAVMRWSRLSWARVRKAVPSGVP